MCDTEIIDVARPNIRVSEIGEFIRHNSCERRFKLEANNRAEARWLPFADRLFNALDPVLQAAGRLREDAWETQLQENGLADLTHYSLSAGTDDRSTDWDVFAAAAAGLQSGQGAYGREVRIEGVLGEFRVEGRIDFLALTWHDGRPMLRLVECKASRRDRTYHRIQVAVYRLLIRQRLPITIGGISLKDIECVVARIDESSNEIQPILGLDPLDLTTEEADVQRLMAADGTLRRIVDANIDELSYQLDQKCDGCVFSVHCLPESARQRRIELIGVEPSTVRVLSEFGVSSIDDLATMELDGWQAEKIRSDLRFTENLEHLRLRAASRRRTLPMGDADPDEYEVTALTNTGYGQLPPHQINGEHLVRVYLTVDYDYSENRVGALSAHITSSEGLVYTAFEQIEGRWAPDSLIREQLRTGNDANGRPVFDERPLLGRDMIKIKKTEWSGDYICDTEAERELIESFLNELIDTVAEMVTTDQVLLHFYVWSRSEMTQLVEACFRCSSRLLGHLHQLLGCRESLEQLIYSCLQDEVSHRYALGWTGRGLCVVTSLRWFGRRYHWRRRIDGTDADLDRVFEQDVFDFKTDLQVAAEGRWAEDDSAANQRHKFEIRSRFHDSLPAPYWHAYWGTLTDPDDPGLNRQVANSIRRYNRAARPGCLREYLRARVHCLRWVEERVSPKNTDIDKVPIPISDFPNFSLGVNNVSRAGIDFLRLDQHVKATDWIAAHLIPPAYRVPLGQSLPISDLASSGGNTLSARIDLAPYGLDLTTMQARCTIANGSFVRLSPHSGNPNDGQSLSQLTRGGLTGVVDNLDWQNGRVTIRVIPGRADRYRLSSRDFSQDIATATIDDSISDFVAGHVDARLSSGRGSHVDKWFNPEDPRIPVLPTADEVLVRQCEQILREVDLPNGARLVDDQIGACLDGLSTRVQLLLGPPGTGKTQTTAVAVLMRILAARQVGDVVLLAGHTHTAIDNLLKRIDTVSTAFQSAAERIGIDLPSIRILKAHSSFKKKSAGNIEDIEANSCAGLVDAHRKNSVLIIGGTTSAILKMGKKLSQDGPDGFQASTLIVDEASMMLFPHFLSLTTFVSPIGQLMLVGDHRQLPPIVAHDWEREDRPPVVLYQPFASAYEAIDRIIQNQNVPEAAATRSALRFTFRLPPLIRNLISRVYSRLDNILLEGHPVPDLTIADTNHAGWESVWQRGSGLYLVLHDERESKQSNQTEIDIIESILHAGTGIVPGSVAVITPHRAQRTLLQTQLADFCSPGQPVDLIDTVERLQGDERPSIIVSATVSDPSAISARAEFILDLNRANVAFSRTQERLIVVCAKSLLDHIPVELEHYESAMLWKSLRAVCSELIASVEVDGHTAEIYTPGENEIAAANSAS